MKEGRQSGKELNYRKFIIIIPDFNDVKDKELLDSNINWHIWEWRVRSLLQAKTFENQKHHKYKETIKIFNSYSSMSLLTRRLL